jgi:intracellular multiplication protein IcmD
MVMKLSVNNPLKKILMVMVVFAGFVFFSVAFADGTTTNIGLSGIAYNVTQSFRNIAKLITAASFIAGLGFAVASIFKFKAHKDNPTQITIGVPIAMLFIAVALLFTVYLFTQLGVTVFGTAGSAGTWQGVSGLDVVKGV